MVFLDGKVQEVEEKPCVTQIKAAIFIEVKLFAKDCVIEWKACFPVLFLECFASSCDVVKGTELEVGKMDRSGLLARFQSGFETQIVKLHFVVVNAWFCTLVPHAKPNERACVS
jgi:hypothetical protein